MFNCLSVVTVYDKSLRSCVKFWALFIVEDISPDLLPPPGGIAIRRVCVLVGLFVGVFVSVVVR